MLPHYFVAWRDEEGDKHLTLVILALVGSCESKTFRAMIRKGGKVLRVYHEWSELCKAVDAYGYGVYMRTMKRTLGFQAVIDKLKTPGTNSIVSTMDIKLPFQVDEIFYVHDIIGHRCWRFVQILHSCDPAVIVFDVIVHYGGIMV